MHVVGMGGIEVRRQNGAEHLAGIRSRRREKAALGRVCQPIALHDHLRAIDHFKTCNVDGVGAGVGECVLFTFGSAARVALNVKAPVDAVIVAIVDSVDVEGTTVEKP